jgi:hypothetical protein
MPKDKMVSKIFDYITDQMGTLINHDCQWTSKSYKDMIVQKRGNYYKIVAAKWSRFPHFVA